MTHPTLNEFLAEAKKRGNSHVYIEDGQYYILGSQKLLGYWNPKTTRWFDVKAPNFDSFRRPTLIRTKIQ